MGATWSTGEQVLQSSPLGAIPAMRPSVEGLVLDPHYRRGEPAAAHPQDQPGAEYVVVTAGPDGSDYTVRCDKHRWQGLPSPVLPGGLARCPLCLAHREAVVGQQRYRRARGEAA